MGIGLGGSVKRGVGISFDEMGQYTEVLDNDRIDFVLNEEVGVRNRFGKFIIENQGVDRDIDTNTA